MLRLIKKGFFVYVRFLKKIEVMNVSGNKEVIKIWLRFLIVFL